MTGVRAEVLALNPRINLLDSALHAPQAGFGGYEMYPAFVDKAAVLVVRIARNHPLLDGNKRLAWSCLNLFCAVNDHSLRVTSDEAVLVMLAIADGSNDENDVASWIAIRLA